MTTSPKPRLTIAIIVRNDAVGLSQTLNSIEAIADEIIVCDTGSSDDTIETAQQFGAKVVEFEWCDDFSAARNAALAAATGDWVLWLDASETLSRADAEELKQSLATGQLSPEAAYMMIVKPPAAPGVIAAEQIARLRLIPRRDGVRFQGRIRESLHETLDNVGIRIEGLPQRILRGPREHDEATKRSRAQRNLQLAEQEVAERDASPQLLNALAEAAQTLGEITDAVELYSQCLEADTSPSCERLEAYYGLLTSLDGTPNARQAQLALCVKALEQFPLDAQLLCAMGGYLQADDRFELAIRSYQTAYEYGRVNPLVWHLDEITAIAAVCWNVALQAQGNDDEAQDVLQNAIEREGRAPRLARALMELHIKHGRKESALEQIATIATSDEAKTVLKLAVTGACLASGQQWALALPMLQEAFDADCRDVTCLRWLTMSLTSTQNYTAAKTVLTAWRLAHGADVEPLRIWQAIEQAENVSLETGNESRKRRVDAAGEVSATMRVMQPAATSRTDL